MSPTRDAGDERRDTARERSSRPVLPDRAAEDDPRAWGEDLDAEDTDARLRADVPPHWS